MKHPVFPMSDGVNPTPVMTMSTTDQKKRIGLVGTKLGMTSLWDSFGVRMPVTVIKIDANTVIATRFHNGKWRAQVGACAVTNLRFDYDHSCLIKGS